MKLLVIRHARAESVKEFAQTGADDDLRPLTEDGRARMRLGAAGLRRVVESIDVLATSPLVRARETAEIVAAAFGALAPVEVQALRPGTSPEALVAWLSEAGARETVAIVGHDSHLSELVGAFLTGKPDAFVEIKKGAAVLLEVRAGGGRIALGDATLLWSLAPRQLRILGGEGALPEAAADVQRAEE